MSSTPPTAASPLVMGEWRPVAAPPPKRAAMTRTQQLLVGVVGFGVLVIAAIGFAGSYSAVKELAERKGFGDFAPFVPIGIDAGIVVLLALDMLLTWRRIPYPVLRQTAWLLTAATVAFNGAAAWPDPLSVGMHAVIPVLFIITVEAARHAVGRIADITADRHIESPPMVRWLLDPAGTFRVWRRMRMWHLRSYQDVIELQREASVLRERLRAEHGRRWRKRAGADQRMALRLARYGTPIEDTIAAEGARRERLDVVPVSVAGRSRVSICGALIPVPQVPKSGQSRQPVSAAVSAPSPARVSATVRTERPTRERPSARSPKPKATRSRAPKKPAPAASVERRVERVQTLTTELGRRPEWTEIRDALAASGLADASISRPTCQRLRDTAERAHADQT